MANFSYRFSMYNINGETWVLKSSTANKPLSSRRNSPASTSKPCKILSQKLSIRETPLTWTLSWLTFAPSSRSSAPSPNQTRRLATKTRDNRGAPGAAVPAPSTVAPVEGEAVEVVHSLYSTLHFKEVVL